MAMQTEMLKIVAAAENPNAQLPVPLVPPVATPVPGPVRPQAGAAGIEMFRLRRKAERERSQHLRGLEHTHRDDPNLLALIAVRDAAEAEYRRIAEDYARLRRAVSAAQQAVDAALTRITQA